MRRGLLALLVTAVFGFAGAAAAAPPLVVGGSTTALGARGSTAIDLLAPGGASGFVLYAPPGYAAGLAVAPGSAVGRVLSASADLGTGPVSLAGSLVAADPADYGDDACAPGSHAAVWLLALSGPGGEMTLPLFVDPAGPAEAAFASYRIQACLGGGSLLYGLSLDLDAGTFTNPRATGSYTWRAVFSGSAGAPAVEARSTLLLPARLLLYGTLGSGRAVLTGTLTAGGMPVARRTIPLWAGGSRSGAARTGADGRFRVSRPIARPTVFRASISVPARDVTGAGCGDPIAPGGCVSAVLSPFSVASNVVRVSPPRAPLLRLGSRGADVRRLQDQLIRLRYLPWGSARGVFDDRTWHAVVAFQGWRFLGRTGVVDRRTWSALSAAVPPQPWGGLEHGLEVDIARQVLLLVQNGRTVRAVHVSTAAPGHFTPRGHFRVYRKETLSWSIPFHAWMPYANYFTGGFAIHGFASVPSYPASHGCIRVPMVDATTVYRFAAYGLPVLIR